jgi:hypothetical protein
VQEQHVGGPFVSRGYVGVRSPRRIYGLRAETTV